MTEPMTSERTARGRRGGTGGEGAGLTGGGILPPELRSPEWLAPGVLPSPEVESEVEPEEEDPDGSGSEASVPVPVAVSVNAW
jgi:hypothetical protein